MCSQGRIRSDFWAVAVQVERWKAVRSKWARISADSFAGGVDCCIRSTRNPRVTVRASRARAHRACPPPHTHTERPAYFSSSSE